MTLTMKKYLFLFSLLALFFACDDPYEGTSYDVIDVYPAGNYLESRSEDFSEWITILKYADLFNAINEAGETFTILAPTNDAVQAFYEAKGVSSIEDLGKTYAKALVKYHVINDEIDEKEFLIGGKLTTETVSGDYLTISYGTSGDDADVVYVNGEAQVTELANEVSNGLIYTLNGVLTPLVETIYDRLDQDDSYSIFKEAVEMTGWDDALSTVSDTVYSDNGVMSVVSKKYTLLAVSNDVFANEGVSTVSGLVSLLGASDDYSSEDNSLYQYISYHILSQAQYVEDLFPFDENDSTVIWSTKASQQVLSTSSISGSNYFNYSKESASGISLVDSDIEAKNGVVHSVDNYMPIFTPDPLTVIWDLANYDDVESAVNAYGADNDLGDIFQIAQESGENWITFDEDAVTSYTWKAYSSAGSYPTVGYMLTKTTDGGLTNTYGAYKNDFLVLNLGYLGNVSMSTPTILPGKYKVELYYACASSLATFVNGGSLCKVSMDSDSEEVYVYDGANASVGIYSMTLFDEITFDTTDDHTFKLVILDSRATTNSSYRLQLDYIKFTPIND